MLKYAKIINTETGLCEVGLGTNETFYKSLGMQKLDVMQSEIDEQWYLSEKLNTEAYSLKKQEYEKETRKFEIQNELNTLDLKRIRAICEPELKNPETGETWLEYYNNQILTLRDELTDLTS